MAWVRLDDQAPRNAKMLKAGPAACWLWVCAIAHCQSQLTDGFVSLDVLPMIGVSGGPRVRRLADQLVAAGLFDRAEGGYRVHDYLDHNESRADAIKRKGGVSTVRSAAGRIGGIKSGSTRRATNQTVEANPKQTLEANRSPIPSHPIPSEEQTEKARASLSPAAPPADPKRDPFTDTTITERAGRFLDRYPLLYQQHRHGAFYALKPMRDYAAAVTLCQTWPDDRLDRLAVIFLTTDHRFAEEGSRTVPQFLALASWCDGKLAEHEAKKAGAA